LITSIGFYARFPGLDRQLYTESYSASGEFA